MIPGICTALRAWSVLTHLILAPMLWLMMKVLSSVLFSDELTETEKLIKMIVLVMGSNV